jgi:ribonuclease PH
MMHTNILVGVRNDGRTSEQVRPVSLEYDQFGYAECSVLLSVGNTRVQASVTLQKGVPLFLRKKGIGWLTAEYAMLPTATRVRTHREAEVMKKQGRSIEISRLIGRCLRSVTSLNGLGERTIMIDCDVLQADGGTRAACITAASLALVRAIARWKQQGIVPASVESIPLAAVSAGVVDGVCCIDLNQDEDTRATADVLFVCTQSGGLIEIQGTSEKGPLSWDALVTLKEWCCRAAVDVLSV